jgi:predicted aspartyl protease
MRFAVGLLALSALLASAAAAAPLDPLAALAAANGHPAGLHFRATGTRVVGGRTVTTTFEQLGPAQLLERCIAGVCGGTWFDGAREWTFGLNEVALPEAVDESTLTLRTLAAVASYDFTEPAFRTAGGSVTAAGPGRWRVRARDGLELIAVVDPATQTVSRVETAGGHPFAIYGHPTKAGGATFPLERAGPTEAGVLDDVAVVAGPLGPPPGTTPAFAAASPLPLAADPVPIVPCSIGGRSARCLLDSGATPSAISLPLAEALNLEPHGELEIAGFSRFATGFVETGPLLLGAARFARARFAVVPPSSAARFDVVVGSDLLGRVRLVLDRRQGTAQVLAPGGSAGASSVSLTFRAGSPIVPAQLGPQGVRALLDTGDEAVVSFGYALYRVGPAWPVVARGQASGIAGAEDAFSVDIPEVRVGSVALGTTRALVRRTQAEAHVGVGLWTRFVLDLDEQSERISFGSR